MSCQVNYLAPSFVPRNNCKTELCMWETEGVDSKKSPTKCIIHGQAGKFLLTVFFLADRKKKQKEIFLLTICP